MMAKRYLAAKDVVAGMSIYDPTPGHPIGLRVVLVLSTEYKETTKLLQGRNGTVILAEDDSFEMLLMDDSTTWSCRIGADFNVELAAPKFVMPPPRKLDEG
jgi:hypothetical protein